jgi:hypothetical protein
MSQGDAAFGHHLDEVTRAELECQIPPDAQDNNFLVKMPTLEEILRRNGVRHLRPLSPCTDLFKRLHQNQFERSIIGWESFNAGLNKSEAKNALARAVFFNRLGELRDRSFENQRYRASGLNLVVLAIILWNTIYLERAINALRRHGIAFPDALLTHVSPIGWEHINLTGDYTWHANRRVAQGRFRALRPIGVPITVDGAYS